MRIERRIRFAGLLAFAVVFALITAGFVYLLDDEREDAVVVDASDQAIGAIADIRTRPPNTGPEIPLDVPGDYGSARTARAGLAASVRTLQAPWSPVTLTVATSAGEIASQVEGLEWVLRWDATRQEWDSWTNGPAGATDPPLPLEAGEAVWLRVAADTELRQPAQQTPQFIETKLGWNLLGWNGSEITPRALAALLGVEELWVSPPSAQRFALFSARTARLGAPRTVPYGSAVWFRADSTRSLQLIEPLLGRTPPIEPAASGLLGASADGSRLYAVNTDSATITIVDVGQESASEKALVQLSVGTEPRGIAVDPRGGRVYVSNFADDSITVLDVDRGRTLRILTTGRHPYGVVVSADATHLYVAESGAASIQEFDTATLTPRRRFAVQEEPRGLAISEDGRRLLATHLFTGHVTEIDLRTGEVDIVHSNGVDGNAAQFITFSPGGRLAFVPMIFSRTANRDPVFDTTVLPVVGVVQPGLRTNEGPEPLLLSAIDRPVALPFALDFSPDGDRIYVINSASNDVSVVDLSDLSAIAHIPVGANPRAIHVNAAGSTAYVLNALAYDIAIIDLATHTVVDRLPVGRSPLSSLVQRGKELFFSSDAPELALNQWVSCSVCHFEGLHDQRTWIFPDGPRNTPIIRGLANTAPFHWSGDRESLFDFQDTIIDRQGGTGLSEADTAALAAFLESTEVEPSPNRTANGSPAAEATRGEALFFAQGCGTCHAGAAFSDGLRHDVGTALRPEERLGGRFDTPSLLGLFDAAPYLHDGSAPTLADLLSGTPAPHGVAANLEADELEALIAFLVSLPQRDRQGTGDGEPGSGLYGVRAVAFRQLRMTVVARRNVSGAAAQRAGSKECRR